MSPTNLGQGAPFSASLYSSLQPASDNAVLITRGLLGDRYHRLNPAIMALPTLAAAFIAKWKPCREWVLEQIGEGLERPGPMRALEDAADFITNGAWK